MDNLMGLLGINIVERIPNSRVAEFFGMKKELDKRI